ncbi:MAG: NADP-dependent isocitrate dehydrogenase [Eubacteriales bacterium]|nr:NADP-dependent isocitrate dehydrogenase [Eubacteriales bacterium]
MAKIPMNKIVEMDGDEMARVLWSMVKQELLEPYVELNTEYYDLAMKARDDADDQNTVAAGEAIKKYHVGVKCATITANRQRVEEFDLKKMWPSPNGTIRGILDGTVFRTPILTSRVKPYIPTWVKPITIARHAYGDVYQAVEYRIEEPGRAELVFTPANGGEPMRTTVYEFKGPGILQSMHNRDDSILSFARSCFEFALSVKRDLWFSAKDTISKQYDQNFKLLFQNVYDEEYAARFEEAGIQYFYALIDDAAARILRSEGGLVWALKNYDGDVMSDLVSTAFGSLGMMTSCLVSPDGNFEYEAAHGTITRHYRLYQQGKSTSTNPVAILFAWTGALRKRGELDGNAPLCEFADRLERATLDTIEAGIMTRDLSSICPDPDVTTVDTLPFLRAVRERLENA